MRRLDISEVWVRVYCAALQAGYEPNPDYKDDKTPAAIAMQAVKIYKQEGFTDVD